MNNAIQFAEIKGLDTSRTEAVVSLFKPLWEQAQSLVSQSATINVTDATQVTEMRKARDARLALKKVRVEAENHRKEQKEAALREGKAIDDIARNIKAIIEPEESRLEECEKFAERAEAARKAKLLQERTDALSAIGAATIGYSLGEMPEAEWSVLLRSKTEAIENAKREAREAEEKKRKEEAEREAERVKLREENARLERERKEADERARAERAEIERQAAEERRELEAKAKIEREKAEAERRAAVDAQRKAEAELAEKRLEEQKAKAEAERERKRMAAAPDKEKATEYLKAVVSVVVPTLDNTIAQAQIKRAMAEFNGQLNKIIASIGEP